MTRGHTRVSTLELRAEVGLLLTLVLVGVVGIGRRQVVVVAGVLLVMLVVVVICHVGQVVGHELSREER